LRYAAAEVALIFVGISLAFAFDEWRAERNRQEKELELLSEIQYDLRQLSEELDEEAFDARQRLNDIHTLSESIRTGEFTESGALQLLSASIETTNVIARTAGYSALQSYGLDVVSDTRLRSSITNYFELQIIRIESQATFSQLISEPIVEHAHRHIELNPTEPMPPYKDGEPLWLSKFNFHLQNTELLTGDKPLAVKLALAYIALSITVSLYTQSSEMALELAEEIELHIDQLR
jgi:hypothetical protein